MLKFTIQTANTANKVSYKDGRGLGKVAFFILDSKT